MIDPGDEKPSYGHLFGRLVQDGEDFAKARVAVYRELAAYRAAQIRSVAGLAFAALFMIEAALVVLLVGVLLAIASCIGFVWATVIVAGGAFAIAALLLVLARNRFPDFGKDPLEEPMALPEDIEP